MPIHWVWVLVRRNSHERKSRVNKTYTCAEDRPYKKWSFPHRNPTSLDMRLPYQTLRVVLHQKKRPTEGSFDTSSCENSEPLLFPQRQSEYVHYVPANTISCCKACKFCVIPVHRGTKTLVGLRSCNPNFFKDGLFWTLWDCSSDEEVLC